MYTPSIILLLAASLAMASSIPIEARAAANVSSCAAAPAGGQAVVEGAAAKGGKAVVEGAAAKGGKAVEGAAAKGGKAVEGAAAKGGKAVEGAAATGGATGAGGATAAGGADFGTCDPSMDFQLGRAGRKADEGTFLPTDPVVAKGQQDALNPNIITNRICDQLGNVCGADQAAIDLCLSAKATVAALGTKDATTADAFNAALGL